MKNNTADDYEYAGIKYPTIIGTSAIWDVNDASSADDEVSAGSFSYDLDKNAVIITTNDDRILQTAWCGISTTIPLPVWTTPATCG